MVCTRIIVACALIAFAHVNGTELVIKGATNDGGYAEVHSSQSSLPGGGAAKSVTTFRSSQTVGGSPLLANRGFGFGDGFGAPSPFEALNPLSAQHSQFPVNQLGGQFPSLPFAPTNVGGFGAGNLGGFGAGGLGGFGPGGLGGFGAGNLGGFGPGGLGGFGAGNLGGLGAGGFGGFGTGGLGGFGAGGLGGFGAGNLGGFGAGSLGGINPYSILGNIQNQLSSLSSQPSVISARSLPYPKHTEENTWNQ